MSGTLVMEGLTFQFDAAFKDDGEPPVYGMQGNQRVLMNPGRSGHPEVYTFEGQYFYKNGELVTKVEDIDWISEPYRSQALKFVADLLKKPAVKQGKTVRLKLPRLRVQTPSAAPLKGSKVNLTQVDPSTTRFETAQPGR